MMLPRRRDPLLFYGARSAIKIIDGHRPSIITSPMQSRWREPTIGVSTDEELLVGNARLPETVS